MHYLPQDPHHEHFRGDVRGWSPQARLLLAAGVVLAVSLVPAQLDALVLGVPAAAILGGVALVLAAVVIFTGVSWRYLALRWLLFLPWIAMFAVAVPLGRGAAGWPVFAGMVIKAWLGFTTLLIVVRSTPVDDLLRGLTRLGVPQLLVATIATMDRYTFLFRDEFHRLRRAQSARTFGQSRWQRAKTTAGMLGLVLGRAYGRAERVHAAMLSRGYHGTMPIWERTPDAHEPRSRRLQD